MASDADVEALVPEGTVHQMLVLSGTILLASGMLVALGCPICLSNAVVAAGYAVVGVPVAVALDAHDRAEARLVEDTLAARDLPTRTRDALARLRPDAATAAPGGELVVLGYGFAGAGEHGSCFFLVARLAAAGGEEEILLGPWRRSDDAPAPHCASRSELAANGGALTAHIVDESAEILAGVVASRLVEAP